MRCVVFGVTGHNGDRMPPAPHPVCRQRATSGPFHDIIFGGMAHDSTGAADHEETPT